MIGYEKEMRKLFRDMNPGLARRFSIDKPFYFEDNNDLELEMIAMDYANNHSMEFPQSVRQMVVKAISSRRCRSNFGNAGDVVTMMTNAIVRQQIRDSSSKELTIEDFGLEASSEDPIEIL